MASRTASEITRRRSDVLPAAVRMVAAHSIRARLPFPETTAKPQARVPGSAPSTTRSNTCSPYRYRPADAIIRGPDDQGRAASDRAGLQDQGHLVAGWAGVAAHGPAVPTGRRCAVQHVVLGARAGARFDGPRRAVPSLDEGLERSVRLGPALPDRDRLSGAGGRDPQE